MLHKLISLSLLLLIWSCGRKAEIEAPADHEQKDVATRTLLATSYPGIHNDGQVITKASFESFLKQTKDQKVYWPEGAYLLSRECRDIEIESNIIWNGDGRKTVIIGMALRPLGDVEIADISWKDAPIIWRFDASSRPFTDTTDFVARNIYLQNCQMFIRNVQGKYPQIKGLVELKNIIVDTINSHQFGAKGSFMQWYNAFEKMDIRHIHIKHNSAYNYVSLLRLNQGDKRLYDQHGDIYLEDIVFESIKVNSETAPAPVTNKLLIAISAVGGRVTAKKVVAIDCNLPQFDFRGSESEVILQDWEVNCPEIVATSTINDYMIINKNRGNESQWAFTMTDCSIFTGNQGPGRISPAYFENYGNRRILNTKWEFQPEKGAVGIRLSSGEQNPYGLKFELQNSQIINSSVQGKGAFWISDDIAQVRMINSTIDGRNSIYGRNHSEYTMETLSFQNVRFLGGFQTISNRDIKLLSFKGCEFIGADHYNFSSIGKVYLDSCSWTDDAIQSPEIGKVDINFEFGATRYVKWTNCRFDLNRHKSLGSINFEHYAKGLDSLIFNNNYGVINGAKGNQVPVRVGTLKYLEMKNNHFQFGTNVQTEKSALLQVDEKIDEAVIIDNELGFKGNNNSKHLIKGAGEINALSESGNQGYTVLSKTPVTR